MLRLSVSPSTASLTNRSRCQNRQAPWLSNCSTTDTKSMSAPVRADAVLAAAGDHGVEDVDLFVDPVGLTTADPGDTFAPPVALQEAGIAEHPHGDVGIPLADARVEIGQLDAEVGEVGDLVLAGPVAARVR